MLQNGLHICPLATVDCPPTTPLSRSCRHANVAGVRDLVSLITQISKGLIREQRTRRLIMFYGLIAALVMLFLGSVFFGWLRSYPLLFLLYWGTCGWITLLAMLLALFDLLMVRAAAKRARRQLEDEYLGEMRRKNRHDPNPPGARGV